jgi:hypothetical protein
MRTGWALSVCVLFGLAACPASGGGYGNAPPPIVRQPHPNWQDIDLADYSPLPNPDSVRHMRPGVTVGYWEIRRYSVAQGWIAIPGADTSQICAGAMDRMHCRSEFTQAHDRPEAHGGCLYRACLVTTFGDRVDILTEDSAIVRFLAPIDTPAEAALVVRLEGAYWSSEDGRTTSGLRADSAGYLVLVRRIRCREKEHDELRWLVRVKPSGQSLRLREAVATTIPEPCPVI